MLNLVWSVLWALIGATALVMFARHQYHQFGILAALGIVGIIAMIWHSFTFSALVVFCGTWLILLVMAIFSTWGALQMGRIVFWSLLGAAAIAVLLQYQASPITQTTGAGVGKAFPGYVVASVGTPLKAQDAPQGSCDRVKYLAYDAPTGSNNFGAPLVLADPTNVNEAVTELYKAVSCDPLALATDEEFIKNGENLDPATASTNATRYVSDSTRKEWADAINRIRERTASYYLVNADGIHYDSLGMIPGASSDVMPTLTKFSQQPDLGLALVLVDKDGHESAFRIWCRIQPAVKQFAKVTPAPAVVQPAPPKSPGIPPKPKGTGTPPKPPSSSTPPGSATSQPPSNTPTTQPSTTSTAPPTSTTETLAPKSTSQEPANNGQVPTSVQGSNPPPDPNASNPGGSEPPATYSSPAPVPTGTIAPGATVPDTSQAAPPISNHAPPPDDKGTSSNNPDGGIPAQPNAQAPALAPQPNAAPVTPDGNQAPAAPAPNNQPAPQVPAASDNSTASPGNSDTANIPAPYPTNDSSSGNGTGHGGGIGGTIPGAGMMLLVPTGTLTGVWIRRKLNL